MIGVLLPSDRRPEMSVDSAPNAPAVDVTITSALTPFRRLTVLLTSLPPSEWYVSWSMTFSAHAFAIGALFPCVSQVLSTICRPPTPPFAFQYFRRSFAAASAGLSNGAMAPLLSNAHPLTIGEAPGDDVCAAAVAAY